MIFKKRLCLRRVMKLKYQRPFKVEHRNEAGAATRVGLISP
jgi:hypothetical protein